MDDSQTFAEVAEITEAVESLPVPEKVLKFQQDMWIDYNALGGLLMEPDGSFKMSATRTNRKGEPKRYSIEDLADDLDVTSRTLYNWRNSIPNFWERVAQRQKVLYSQQRVVKVWNGVFLKAAAGEAQQARMFLTNFDKNYVDPNKPTPGEQANTLIELMNAVRNTRKVIEGEVVPQETDNAG